MGLDKRPFKGMTAVGMSDLWLMRARRQTNMTSRPRMPAPEPGFPHTTRTSATTTTFPAVPAVPTPSREELLRRLHERQKSARSGGKGTAAVAADPTPARKAVDKAIDNAMTMSPAQQGKIEKLLEECGGDIGLFCEKYGVDRAYVPTLQKAIASITAGADAKEAISAATAEVMTLTKDLRK